MKRAFDVLVVLAFAPAWCAVAAFVAAAVLLFDGRPVFFLHRRAGLGGEPFDLVKFRTMKDGAVTRLGRLLRATSLDEIPELFHVLSGRMSLVGPRPLPVEYLPRYTAEQAKRHLVRPGITGWAQIHGRNAVSWDDKFAYDVWYAENRTFMLDMKILLLTIPSLLASPAPMTEFLGSGGADPLTHNPQPLTHNS